eukprot:TRINITY_DN80212_c0_g1_i1.p1 TRINITY_DN80212_c0_g1~~TRINITY_DN80212_c0_g1_i1.p1  ORF type:complete len:464 (-),score=69.45 TRINITY_DN80212_c0_g1_i1:105-1496(-)
MADVTYRPTSPLNGSGPTGDVDNQRICQSTRPFPRSPIPGNIGRRLPREGRRGGGCIKLAGEKDVVDSVMHELEMRSHGSSSSLDPRRGSLRSSRSRRSSVAHHPIIEKRGGIVPRASVSGFRNAGGDGSYDVSKMSAEERKKYETFTRRLDKLQAQREIDQKEVEERVEKGTERREERFKRLLEAVTGKGNLAYKTAMALREREAHEEHRRLEQHAAWNEKVYQPLAEQLEDHMNPPSRKLQQDMNGSKSVDFTLPDANFNLVANVAVDPARKPVVDWAREQSFHLAANAMLRRSSTAPEFHNRQIAGPPEVMAPWPAVGGSRAISSAWSSGHLVPRATSRPVLEPMNWGQRELQGTMFGHFSQVCETGPGFQRSQRGGTNAHLPDDSDGPMAGTRKNRTLGLNDYGILRGDEATRGQAAGFKSFTGSSSAAPMQDHFTYETGTAVTSLEFPLGKRMFPEFH